MSLASRTVAVPEENRLNAVIYARFSSERQTENSIDFQLRADKAYCEQKGFRVVGEYIDRAMTGTNDNRPEFQRMIADAKKRQFAFVIVYRFDRFARNRYDSAIYKKQLELSGVRVLSTEESVGTGDEGIILESIYEAMAESYSRKLSRIVTEGMKQKAMAGLSTGGNPPYAYKVIDHRLTVDEEKAPAVRLAFEMYADGKTKSKIARELTARGYRTRKGNDISVSFVSGMLSNPTFKGENDYCGVKRESPAIVTEELYDKVQDLLKKNKRQYGKKTECTYFALTGKLFCGHCGAAMIGDSGNGKGGTYYYYSCINKKKRRTCKKKSERKDWLEKFVCEQTAIYILDPKNTANIAKRVEAASADDLGIGRLKELERERRAINKEIDDAANAIIKASSQRLIDRINAKVDALEKRLDDVDTEISELKLRREMQLTAADVELFLRGFAVGNIDDPEYRRKLINTLVNAVYVWDDKIIIYYNVSGVTGTEVTYSDAIQTAETADTSETSESPLPADSSDSLCNGSPNETNPNYFVNRNWFGFVFYYTIIHNNLCVKNNCDIFFVKNPPKAEVTVGLTVIRN